MEKFKDILQEWNLLLSLPSQLRNGDVAQLVEQRTENPCVGGSIPSITTKRKSMRAQAFMLFLFVLHSRSHSHSFSERERRVGMKTNLQSFAFTPYFPYLSMVFTILIILLRL